MAIDLKEQVGPLPLGAWIIVVGGGLGIAWYTKQSQPPPTVVEDTSNPPGVGEGPGWIAVPPPSNAPPVTDTSPTTNEEWGRLAINWLIAQGYDPGTSDSAIRKYLEVQSLSLQEDALLKVALRHFGSPPVPLPSPPSGPVIPGPVVPPPPVVTPPPVVKPPPVVVPPPNQPPKLRYFVITPWPTPGSTLWGIARHFYGNGNRWPEIYNVNRNGYTRPDGSKGWINNPNLIYAGRAVWVP